MPEHSRNLPMYCIHDTETGVYDTPFFALDDIHAKRHFIMVGKKEGMVATFTEKFQLLRLAEFEKMTGSMIVKEVASRVIMDGVTLKAILEQYR